jgi:integrase
MLRLLNTSSTLLIYKDQQTHIKHGEVLSTQVGNPNAYNGVKLLFQGNEPIFHANAYILYLRIVINRVDTSPTERALKAFFQVLYENDLKWDECLHIEDCGNPIFAFRNVLQKNVNSGHYTDSTASIYLGCIRSFYMFLKKFFYVEQLPYTVVGTTPYGNNITDCTIKRLRAEVKLRPISDRHLNYIFDHLSLIPFEARLAMLLSLFSGLRRYEAITLTKRHLAIPRGFEGETLSDISISPASGVHTKRGKKRQISIPLRIAQLFNQYHSSLRYKERLSLWLELENAESEYEHPAILNQNGEIYNPKTINRYWSTIANKIAGEDDPRFQHVWHHLRVTFGCRKISSLIDYGFSYSQALGLLKEEMGHSSIATTQLYLTHWTGNHESIELIEVMGDMVEKIMNNNDLWVI